MTQEYPPTWQYDTDTGAHAAAVPVYDQVTYTETQTPTDTETDTADQGKAGAAKEQAAVLGQGAAQAGAQVASVAKDQVQGVVAEAGSQARDLVGQARSELTEQAGSQQKRLVETLRSLGAELESMGQHSGEPGMATDLVKQVSGRAHDAASWLDGREPGSLFSELQSFARQRPGAFLALAAGAGLVAGRLGRGVKDASSDDAPSTPSVSAPAPSATPSAPASFVDETPVGTGFGGSGTDEPRPFASSQDADYPYDGGIGR